MGLPACPYNQLFHFDDVYMIDGVTRLGGLSGLPGRVTLSAKVIICYVHLSRWGNPPGRGGFYVTKRSNEQKNSETRVC